MAFKPQLFFCLFCILSLLAVLPASAQLDRSERRVLRREMRRMPPEEFNRMKEELLALHQKVTELSQNQSQLQQEIQDKDRQINTLKNELTALEAQLNVRREEIAEIRKREEQWEHGIVFRVQIAAFKGYNLKEIPGTSDYLRYEEDRKWQKYVLGNFRQYEDADKLKKHLRKTGIRDAWIVPYKDGQRVSLKEVLDQVVEEIKN